MSENLTKSNIHGWTPISFYEDLITLRETNPKAFGYMSSATHAALLAYEKAKRKAHQDDEAAA
jgi:hypothetical protein